MVEMIEMHTENMHLFIKFSNKTATIKDKNLPYSFQTIIL